MPLVLNNCEGVMPFEAALRQLTTGAESLSLAVSYLQVGGWELFRAAAGKIDLTRVRILCTDQMGITHPAAVKRAMDAGVQIRNFEGRSVYHPKAFVAQDGEGRPIRCLLGSANLSTAAFTSSVEAGFLCAEKKSLIAVSNWFDDLFSRCGAEFTPDLLERMEIKWKAAAAARARVSLLGRIHPTNARPETENESEKVDSLEDILSTLQPPFGLLNMDCGGNNIRNIEKAREVLADRANASNKQRNELKLLGFLYDGSLTELGQTVAAAGSNEEVARAWCRWLRVSSEAELNRFSSRLVSTRKVLQTFWSLQEDVCRYFLNNAQGAEGSVRRLLQTIELVCNGSSIVSELSLENVRLLSALLDSEDVPTYIRDEIGNYFNNKGNRSWSTPDRRIVPLAWREATED